jgi:uncharacterized surface protein with fasciclin (FAS1) repeats
MNRQSMKDLRETVAILLVASTILLVASTFTLAQDGMAESSGVASSGTITKIDALTGEFTVKDRDGKSYVIKKTDVVAQDLKTGDTVVYEIIGSAPANVHKGSSGKIVKIDAVTGDYTVQGSDGKSYVVKKADVVARDLKTGDTVAYEIVDGVPAHVVRSES